MVKPNEEYLIDYIKHKGLEKDFHLYRLRKFEEDLFFQQKSPPNREGVDE